MVDDGGYAEVYDDGNANFYDDGNMELYDNSTRGGAGCHIGDDGDRFDGNGSDDVDTRGSDGGMVMMATEISLLGDIWSDDESYDRPKPNRSAPQRAYLLLRVCATTILAHEVL